jgi:hypothetical protein
MYHEECIAAFENPLTGQYERLPEGYDPPNPFAIMHFMAQNKGSGKKTASFGLINPYTTNMAQGDVLRVRYVPRGETVEPLLVHDRATGKVIKYRSDTQPTARTRASSATMEEEVDLEQAGACEGGNNTAPEKPKPLPVQF